MFAALPEYILPSLFSHLLALTYTLWALGILPHAKPRVNPVPRIFVLSIATLASLVFLDGGINIALYYGYVLDTQWFHLKAILTVIILFFPHFPSELTPNPTLNSLIRGTPSSPVMSSCFTLVIFGASLAISWMFLPWLYDNFPVPQLSTDPAWDQVWNILFKVPFQTVPLVFTMRSVYLDQQMYTNRPPPQYNGYGTIPEYRSPMSVGPKDDVPHYAVAYFALLPVLGQLDAPWEKMTSFERSVSVISTTALIMIVMRCYFRVIRLA